MFYVAPEDLEAALEISEGATELPYRPGRKGEAWALGALLVELAHMGFIPDANCENARENGAALCASHTVFDEAVMVTKERYPNLIPILDNTLLCHPEDRYSVMDLLHLEGVQQKAADLITSQEFAQTHK